MMTGIISTYASGVDLVVEWTIDNFFNLSEGDGATYDSPEFSFGGEKWWLRIYPNGRSGSDSSGHLSLRLCKYGSNRDIKQTLSLSLKTVKGEKYNEQHFLKYFYIVSWVHRIIRLIPRSELTMRRSELVPEGVLTVVCTMKNSTSAESDTQSKFSATLETKPELARKCNERTSELTHQSLGKTASAECRYCEATFNVVHLSSHQKKCSHRPTKCPDCSEVVVLEKWLNEHECHQERPEGEVCASGPSTSHHEKKVFHDFKELFLQKEDCDVVIKVKGSEFPAHRFVLKARSPVFASTFRHNMKERATNIVEIEDCDPSSFLDFLCFLYCGDVEMITRENVFGLFTTADKYKVLDLKTECLEFLKKNVTVDTFCETITLALQHSETELIALATDFFVGNAEEILLTVKWQTFAAENPTQSNELFIKFVRSVKH